jgi:hypothetical protein
MVEEVLLIYGAPLVVLTRLKPVAPFCEPIVAPVVLSPEGVVQDAPVAVVQYSNLIDPTFGLPTEGSVNWKKWFTTPPGLEPGSVTPAWRVKLRVVIWLAAALPDKLIKIEPIAKTPKANLTAVFPLMFIYLMLA